MLKVFFRLILLIATISFTYSQEVSRKILFVGHAYGSHIDKDSKLDETLINFSNNFNRLYDDIVLGGDFIYDCQDEKEYVNLISFISSSPTKLVIGNHDDCDKIKSYINSEYGSLNYYDKLNETLIFYLNTSIKNNNEVEDLFNFFQKVITQEKPKRVLIFSHQVIFSVSDLYLRVNSRKHYNYANKFYQKIYNSYYKKDLKLYFFSGDIGAYNFNPYAFTDSDQNFQFYAVGIGNKKKYTGILININDNIDVNFINLKTGHFLPIEKFSKINNQLYQSPKLILAYIRDNYKFLLIALFVGIVLYLYSKKYFNESQEEAR